MEIKKVYREKVPKIRLIGLPYSEEEILEKGGFPWLWDEWIKKKRFNRFQGMKPLDGFEEAMIGGRHLEGEFVYWIGMFFPEGTAVPDGFKSVDIPKGDLGTCWVYGKDSFEAPDLHGEEVHQECIKSLEERGMVPVSDYWIFERYHTPRFTKPDAKGNVIMDYCVYLK